MQQKRLKSQCWQQQRSQCQIRLPSLMNDNCPCIGVFSFELLC